MKKYLTLIIISLILCTNSYAKWKYKPGDIVNGEVFFGKKDSFKLPPGEFVVAVNSREKEFKDLMLYQIDEKSGYTRWSIHFFATGSTQWEWWNPPKFCERTNVYFIQKKIGNKKYACWMVNHSRSDIAANKGFWAKVRKYEIANNIKTPDIFVYSQYEYSKGPRVWGASYYYNPELDGIPKPKSLEWDTNEFHKQRVMDYPKHEEFLKKYISISAGFIDAFNKTHKIKKSSSTSLNAVDYISSVSINSGQGTSNKNKKKTTKSLTEELKTLKELLDTGAITKEEFKKAKDKLLN
mgnify:FL=1|tara:strand:+ start:220 stop:1104 length:885 start_codon:yes stop_codon:yes gene_type:complete